MDSAMTSGSTEINRDAAKLANLDPNRRPALAFGDEPIDTQRLLEDTDLLAMSDIADIEMFVEKLPAGKAGSFMDALSATAQEHERRAEVLRTVREKVAQELHSIANRDKAEAAKPTYETVKSNF